MDSLQAQAWAGTSTDTEVLTARFALDEGVVEVAPASPVPGQTAPGRVYAVCEQSPEGGRKFLGLIHCCEVIVHPGLAFGDLLNGPGPPPVDADAPLELVRIRLDSEACMALPVIEADAFIGVVTSRSLLKAMIKEERNLYVEMRGLRSCIEADRLQLAAWSRRLADINHASRTLFGFMAHATVERDLLRLAIEALVKLVDSRYGAIGILDDNGKQIEFVVAGMTDEEINRIDHFPEGKGLLGIVLKEAQSLRLDDISADPRSAGFPSGHPLMKSLLAMPIVHNKKVYGRVYLCDKTTGAAFTEQDELAVATFAGTLALAIINTRERQLRSRAEEQARIAAHVFETSAEGILITDADLHILMVNQAFTVITGHRPEDILGRTPRILKSGRHGRKFYQRMWQSLEETGQWQGEIWNRRKNGDIFPEWLSIRALTDGSGKATHYVGVFTDLTERKLSDERIERLVNYDSLTGLPNRMLFREQLKKTLLKTHFNNKLAAVLLIDVDRFKTINDTFGHPTGDRLLQQVAERLNNCLRGGGKTRNGDIVARLGGDEFGVIISDLARSEDAIVVANKLHRVFMGPFIVGPRKQRITPSIGIAVSPAHGDNVDELLANADAAMYYAKREGRNNIQLYQSTISDGDHERLELENDLYSALENGELALYYQPQIDIASGNVAGMEALLRWRHPAHGMIQPHKFVPLLEDTGLIHAVGEWALKTACEQCRRSGNILGDRLNVSVNLSGRQLRPETVETVRSAIEQTGLQPGRLKLELTESLAMGDVEASINVLNGLAGLGVEVSIDDFGTGYSSLSYLKQLRINALKIDKSFVSGASLEPADKAIIRAVIALAHSLNLQVIAEGVETCEQYEFLRIYGCDLVQGYLFSPPLPADELDSFLGNPDLISQYR